VNKALAIGRIKQIDSTAWTHNNPVRMNIIDVVILSFIEGATEFLPVSSTGHLILTSALLGYGEDPFLKAFNIIIQSGAIMAVLVLYWRRFLPNMPFYIRLALAFLPAAIIGLLLKDKIDFILGSDSVPIVAWALIIGGIVLVATDSERFRKSRPQRDLATLSYPLCLALGLIQCLAFIPGVSRSGATILGGLWLGLDQKSAAEFSFFLGVPTLLGASVVKGAKILPTIDQQHWLTLGLGILLSFVFALIAIRFFMALVQRYGFRHFGYYRIVLGAAILAMIYGGWL
jgi:undecaprenyl-diphosphatase